MIHAFPEGFIYEEPCSFTDPFRYVPHPAVQEAAKLIMKHIDESELVSEFAEGKMIGYVMVIYDNDVPEYDIWHMMIDKSMQGLGTSKAKLCHNIPSDWDMWRCLFETHDFQRNTG